MSCDSSRVIAFGSHLTPGFASLEDLLGDKGVREGSERFLRESGSNGQDADVVMFVYRAEYYEYNKELEMPGDHELDKMDEWKQATKI